MASLLNFNGCAKFAASKKSACIRWRIKQELDHREGNQLFEFRLFVEQINFGLDTSGYANEFVIQ